MLSPNRTTASGGPAGTAVTVATSRQPLAQPLVQPLAQPLAQPLDQLLALAAAGCRVLGGRKVAPALGSQQSAIPRAESAHSPPLPSCTQHPHATTGVIRCARPVAAGTIGATYVQHQHTPSAHSPRREAGSGPGAQAWAMYMSSATFQALAKCCDAAIAAGKGVECLPHQYMAAHPLDTLASIYQQRFVRFVKLEHHTHRKRAREYVERYHQGERIVDIADKVNFSPYLLARIVAGEMLGLPKPRLAAQFRDLSTLPDERLQREVRRLIVRHVAASHSRALPAARLH